MTLIKRTVHVASIQIGKASEIDLDRLMGSVMIERAFKVSGSWSVLSKAPKKNRHSIVYDIEDISIDGRFPKFRIEWECLRPGECPSINGGAPDIVFLLMSCQDLLGRDYDVLSDLDGAAFTLNGTLGCPFVMYEFLDAGVASKKERKEIESLFCSADNPGSEGVGCAFLEDEEGTIVENMLSVCKGPICGEKPGTRAYRKLMHIVVERRGAAPVPLPKHLASSILIFADAGPCWRPWRDRPSSWIWHRAADENGLMRRLSALIDRCRACFHSIRRLYRPAHGRI